jgi:hypothetical protein
MAMDLRIQPHEGVGPIKFGLSIRETRRALAEALFALGRGWAGRVATFLKSPERDGLPVDDFSDLGMHIYYRVDGGRVVCDGVELFSPARPTYAELDVLVTPFAEVRSWLATRDPSLEADSAGCRSRALGIALYAPNSDEEPELPAQSLYLFPLGAFDRPLPPVVE